MTTKQDRIAAQLDGIDRLNGSYHAVISKLPEAAVVAAELDRSGSSPGPLAGLSVGVKDVIATAGHPTTMGSAIYRDHVPDADAEVVARIRAAGGVILAKTNLSEFAMGATSHNAHYGNVGNAWDPARVAGGSSGGSAAAVALGLCDAALGTDTGGSIVIPAALNGLTGLRPSLGLVSNRGVYPVSSNFDTTGPIARSVGQVRRLLQVIAGWDPEDPDQPPTAREWDAGHKETRLPGLRIGVPRGHFVAEEPEIAARFEDALGVLAGQGAKLVELELPAASEALPNMATQMFTDFYGVHAERFTTHPEQYGSDLTHRLRLGGATTGVEYSTSRRWTERWRHSLALTFERVDVIVTPATSISAPLIEDSAMATTTPLLTRFTHPWCLSLGPTLSVPIGAGRHSPVGMLITGPAFGERLVLEVGDAYQSMTEWHHHTPEARIDIP
ncbi:amidase [Microbispora bryophytorum]|uniref:amidase n=1 Tax=Microbispora bryophytorum TaxID=1460882 RepID=UPI0033F8588E